ncbi:MAG: TonB-dependent receptor [Mucilaginibacter sp.]|nr:TonB-dependent receptor [Mucilaginibacter sp.]
MFIAGSVTTLGFSQIDDDPIQKIARQLDNWISGHPQEKVYLQTDKSCYFNGDQIWFKASVVVGSQHLLSAISGVLNVDLIDENNSIVQSVRLPVIKGASWGDFSLADSLKEGNYRIRAYTTWMRNADDNYFFNKNITILNSITNNLITKTEYTYNKKKDRESVNVNINYSSLDGKLYAGKPVSYEVMLGAKNITKGKGITDDNGNLHFSFINPSKEPFTRGRIITNINFGKQIVTRQILIKAISSKADIQFFPEGGALINGADSKIAFKAVGADGLGTSVKGVVIDDQNKQVAAFNSTHLGMGVFNFTPVNGRNYKANLIYADGSANTVSLPAAANTGYTMSIDNSNAQYITIKIVPASFINAGTPASVVNLVAQAEGVIYYAGKSGTASSSFKVTIPKSKFPSGIVQFTLFSSTGEPMNERLVFIENHDELRVDVSTPKLAYSPREKVKIELKANNKDGKPVTGIFSIAVTYDTKVPVDEASESTIFSNLLLTSDLKGYIEKPNYYFTASDEKTAADLDVLMLTQGFRRFEWKQVLNKSYPPVIYRPEKTLQISGHIKTPGGKLVVHGKVSLLNTNDDLFMVDTVTDNNGKFVFCNLIFKDSITLAIQARTANGGKDVKIELDTIAPPLLGTNKDAPDMQVNIYDGLVPLLQNRKNYYDNQLNYGNPNHAIPLKEVVIRERKEPPAMLKHSDNLNGPGNADAVILASDIYKMACRSLADCLRLNIKIPTDLKWVLVIIDGVSMDETPGKNFLNALNVNDIESIEYLHAASLTAIYGARGGKGVLIITTKRGDSGRSLRQSAPGIITYIPKGYIKVHEFYSPRYDDPKTNAKIPDLRSTIYWKPNVITNNEGKASVEYFNADTKGTYRVVIEGIDSDGNLGRQIYQYIVK